MDPKEQELHNKRIKNLNEIKQLQQDLSDVIQNQRYEQEELDRLHASILKKQKEQRKINRELKNISSSNVNSTSKMTSSIDKDLNKIIDKVNNNLSKTNDLIVATNRKFRSMSKVVDKMNDSFKKNNRSLSTNNKRLDKGNELLKVFNKSIKANDKATTSINSLNSAIKSLTKSIGKLPNTLPNNVSQTIDQSISVDGKEQFYGKIQSLTDRLNNRLDEIIPNMLSEQSNIMDEISSSRQKINNIILDAEYNRKVIIEQNRQAELDWEEVLAKEKQKIDDKIQKSWLRDLKSKMKHQESANKKYISDLKKTYVEEEKIKKEQMAYSSHPVNLIGGAAHRFTRRIENKKFGKTISAIGGFGDKSIKFKEKFKDNYFANVNAAKQGLLKNPNRLNVMLKSVTQTLGMIRFGAIAASIGIGIMFAAIAGGVALIGWLVKSIIDINQNLADLGKLAGTSTNTINNMVNPARKLANQFTLTAAAGTTFSKVLKTQIEYQKELGGLLRSGGTSKYYDNLLENITLVTHNLGLSVEEASKFNFVSMALGSNMNKLTTDVGGVLGAMESATGVTLDWRGIFRDMSEVPLGLAAGFKGSNTELVMLVQRAKMLGTSLGKLHSIGNGLVDIESSLRNEMEARIIYGKNINLDAARYYQMIGRTDLMFNEILSQAGSLSEFQRKLPFQQESFAKALGMSTDELTEILVRQQNIRDIGFDIYDNNLSIAQLEEKLARMDNEKHRRLVNRQIFEKRSLSFVESLGLAWDKIKEVILGPLVEPMNKVLNHLSAVLTKEDSPFAQAVTNFSKWMDANGKWIVDTLANILNGLPNLLTNMLNGLNSLVDQKESITHRMGESIGNGIMDGMASAFGRMMSNIGRYIASVVFDGFTYKGAYDRFFPEEVDDKPNPKSNPKSKSMPNSNRSDTNRMDDASKQRTQNKTNANNYAPGNNTEELFRKWREYESQRKDPVINVNAYMNTAKITDTIYDYKVNTDPTVSPYAR